MVHFEVCPPPISVHWWQWCNGVCGSATACLDSLCALDLLVLGGGVLVLAVSCVPLLHVCVRQQWRVAVHCVFRSNIMSYCLCVSPRLCRRLCYQRAQTKAHAPPMQSTSSSTPTRTAAAVAAARSSSGEVHTTRSMAITTTAATAKVATITTTTTSVSAGKQEAITVATTPAPPRSTPPSTSPLPLPTPLLAPGGAPALALPRLALLLH